jgi:hypothetical protein
VAKILLRQRDDFKKTRIATLSRLLCRILPIDYTCKPNISDFKKLAETVLPSHVGPDADPTVWALEFKARNTNTLTKELVLGVIDEIVPKGRHKVNINDPVKCILVEANHLFCGLSILSHWAELKKYNMNSLTSLDEPKPKQGSPGAQGMPPLPKGVCNTAASSPPAVASSDGAKDSAPATTPDPKGVSDAKVDTKSESESKADDKPEVKCDRVDEAKVEAAGVKDEKMDKAEGEKSNGDSTAVAA